MYCIVSGHFVWYHIISHYIVSSYRIILYLIVSHHISSYLISSLYCIIISYHISYHGVSHHISLYYIISFCIISYCIISYLTVSHHISSYLVVSNYFVSHCTALSYCTLSKCVVLPVSTLSRPVWYPAAHAQHLPGVRTEPPVQSAGSGQLQTKPGLWQAAQTVRVQRCLRGPHVGDLPHLPHVPGSNHTLTGGPSITCILVIVGFNTLICFCLPCQIPRYIITLHELLAHTPHEHVERKSLEFAKSKLEELSKSVFAHFRRPIVSM